MVRTLIVLAMFAGTLPLYAQPPREAVDGKVVVPIVLTPAGVKKPLSRYYLTPQYAEMKPGNRVQTFMRSLMEQQHFFAREPSEVRDKWNGMKLADLPVEEIKKGNVIGGLAYRDGDPAPIPARGRPLGDVDEGARQLGTDWQIWSMMREDGVGTLLPELQHLRNLAGVLKVRMRYEIRTGDFDKAVYSARTFHGLAKAFESHPTLIGALVGLAVTGVEYEALEEMIQQPDCPNLYWSFTEMPAEAFDIRTGFQGERFFSESIFQPFLLAREPMAEKEVEKHLRFIDQLSSVVWVDGKSETKDERKYTTACRAAAADAKQVDAARRFLRDSGFKADLVDRMPAVQAVVTADVRRYEVLLDDRLIVHALPPAERAKFESDVDRRAKEDGTFLIKEFLPPNKKVLTTHARYRQRLAYLRTIEAVRLFAHEHAGKLPEKLADIGVPVPADPVTGKEFEYAVRDGTATLHGGNPEPANANFNRYYELRVKK